MHVDPAVQNNLHRETTHKVNVPIRSTFDKLTPALHSMKCPFLVSNERSIPSEATLVPITIEKLHWGYLILSLHSQGKKREKVNTLH